MTWYVFRWNESKSDKVREKADKLGVEVLAPEVSKFRRVGRDRKPRWQFQPAYHGYVFFGCDPDLAPALMGLHYSVRPLWNICNGPEPRLSNLPDHEIDRIRSERLFKRSSARDLLSKVVPDPKWTKGELVRTLGGAWAGLEGPIVRIDAEQRKVEIDVKGWPAHVWAEFDLIEAA